MRKLKPPQSYVIGEEIHDWSVPHRAESLHYPVQGDLSQGLPFCVQMEGTARSSWDSRQTM